MSRRQLAVLVIAAFLAPSLISCGGGGGGSGDGPVTGETRVDGPVTVEPRAYERANPGAEDLLDHWNDPERLRSALGLTAVTNEDARLAAIGSLLAGASGNASQTGTRLRNVSADDIEIIGEKDGITYGQWKGGPAGTLNIEFDWRFSESIGAATRARMERAGKSWSYRLADKNRDYEAPSGTVIDHQAHEVGIVGVEETLDQRVSTNGVLIFVLDQGANSGDYSSATWHYVDYNPDVLDPWLASILLSRQHHGDTNVMVHEIGHAIGIFPYLGNHPAYDNLVNRNEHTFEGPRATQANGGNPVPFQWWNAQFEPVPPGTAGAEVDYGHPGVCSSIMAYCSADTLEAPSELDFAILDDLGYEILDEARASEPELYGYGAWGRYGAWGVGAERILSGSSDRLRAGADAFGMTPSTNLADSTVLTGEVTWTGSLLGVDTGHAALPPVFGDAELGVDLADLTGTALFERLKVDVDGVSSAFRMSSLSYDISVSGNGFSDDDGIIAGGFYGPAHEEMAGVLDDRDVSLLASFGGTRPE